VDWIHYQGISEGKFGSLWLLVLVTRDFWALCFAMDLEGCEAMASGLSIH
jgi:hypothetical protein